MNNDQPAKSKIWVKRITKRIHVIHKKNSLASTKVELDQAQISKTEKSFSEIRVRPDIITSIWTLLKWILYNRVKTLKMVMFWKIALWATERRLELCQNLILRLNWRLKKTETRSFHRLKFQVMATTKTKWRLTLAFTIFLDWKPII